MTRLLVAALMFVSMENGMQQADLDPERVAAAARAVMSAARYCALITLDADGTPQARTMDPFPVEDGFGVWMATNASTRKVRELADDPRAALYYIDVQGGAYVTLIGSARVIADDAEKARRWKAAWDDFYTDGNRGVDYVLVHFVADRIEVVSPAHAVASDPMAWRPAILKLDR